ncbi:MAG: argininosuccinate lyase [Bacteroidota bacterium]
MAKHKLWQTNDKSLHPLVETFTVGDDYILDHQLLPYDVKASIVHVEMLFKMNILSKQELESAKKGLDEILLRWKDNTFNITQEQEDGHTAIEQFLTENYGDVGKKIHTGRSRNDQSLVMLRLFMKEKLITIQEHVTQLIAALDKKAKQWEAIAMPGYTHMQKAMPATAGLWLDSFSAAFKDFEYALQATLKITDQNPLGSASGFGIANFPLDRAYTTEKLDFSRTQENPMYCGLSRGYFENIVLQTLSQVMVIAGKFANDMLLFTTQEFHFFTLPDHFTTGSSIMPQKRNYDLMEIMRGNTKRYNAYQNQIQNIVSSMGSGYQRDLQLTKAPFVKGINLCELTLQVITEVIGALQVDEAALKNAMTDDLYVTNEVYELVKKGKSFRTAYMEVKNTWHS